MAGYFFGCPHCRAKLEARDASRAGRTVTCPKCEQALVIPPPPAMGLPLSQSGEPLPAAGEASQVVVSRDPGFKRPMSPAKDYSEDGTPPAPSSSNHERLPLSAPLDTTEAHTIEASDNVEGYSFTLPENGPDDATPVPAFKPRKPKKKSEEAEPPHPFEDPKNQLLALLGVVVVLVAFTAWIRSGGDDKEKKKDQPAEVVVPAPVTPPPVPNPASPAALPGGVAPAAPLPPTSEATLPGALPGTSPAPAALPSDGSQPPPGSGETVLPGGSPAPSPDSKPPAPAPANSDALPGASEEKRPNPTPAPILESPPA